MNRLRFIVRVRKFLKWFGDAYLLFGAIVFGAIIVLATLSAIFDGGKVFNGCDMIWWCHLAMP